MDMDARIIDLRGEVGQIRPALVGSVLQPSD